MSAETSRSSKEIVQPRPTTKVVVAKPATGTSTVVKKAKPATATTVKKPAAAAAPAAASKATKLAAKPAAKTTKPSTRTTPAAKPVVTKPPATSSPTASSAAVRAAAPLADTVPSVDPMPRAVPTDPEIPEATIGTDAAFASDAPSVTVPHTVRNISEVRHFFRTNDVPIFFVGATPFNLLGLDRWVRNFSYVSYYDSWDGAHPRIFTPAHKPVTDFESGEEINNWLLLNAEVRARMTQNLRPGLRPKVALVFFNEETERICRELGYDLILPAAELRDRLDSKIVTTKMGDEAGVPSVPNVLSNGTTFKALREAADAAWLGDELVVQTPYGDSGKTTFFINNESDWDTHSADIIRQDIKVMRRINNLPVAVEAVLTRSGTVVGPFLTELAGHRSLTPYPGGWCGNEMHPEVLTATQRARAMDLVKRMGDRLDTEGYRGFFEVDVLVDTDTDEVYLGELNPRISGASAITNVTAGAYADVPLFLFHLLEYLDVAFELDIDEINARWEALSGADVWSQMIIKETSETVELLTSAPATGQYYLDANGAMVFNRAALDWHMLQNESEAFFLRIYGPGDYRWKGADLGVLVTKGRLQVDRHGKTQLNIRAQHFIDCLRAGFVGKPLDDDARAGFTPGPGVKSQW
ncbi:biotin carboxylase [Paeniglutamicibacter gangotriensis]|uniref:Biotin carboxylase n=1 Tax=Paeniglutamicibacter gangotriensis TaxID=254787 RepID=A0A5B0EEY5_9MICC|nr:biotin carboxylase [Paeniglutamicibacter gangotriensis]KAA0977607.1 biotin carboxylase [Paeniglutamicibacter gangotriensis]